MFILKFAGKILLLPVWLILFVIGLAVKMTVQTYAVVRGILGFIFTLLIIATAYCYHDWVQVAFLFSLSVILYLILFAGVFEQNKRNNSESRKYSKLHTKKFAVSNLSEYGYCVF